MKKPIIGITMGDPASIGPEISVMALTDPKVLERCNPLIVGDAAIRAGLVSPLLIIIIGLTSLTSFVIPSYELASSLRLVKYFLLAFSAVFGIFGLTVGLVLFVSQLCALSSYGTEFTAPFSPAYRKGFVESLIELPIFRRDTRPEYYEPVDLIRMR